MKKEQLKMGLIDGHYYHEAVKQVAEEIYDDANRKAANELRGELLGDKSAAMIPLKKRLHQIQIMLRKVWPADFTPSDNIDFLEKATSKQKVAWHLSLMAGILHRMIDAKSPDIDFIGNLIFDIGMGVMAVAADEQDKAEAKRIATIASEETIRRIKEAEQKKREEARAQRTKRRAKDPRPLPDRHIKAQYANKAVELTKVNESNRQVAELLKKWAVERGDKDEKFNEFRVLNDTTLQKLAAKMRKDQAIEKARRQKKLKGTNTKT